jgi:hypothetical protein
MMTRLQAILKRAETWPEERQEEAADLLLALEQEMAGQHPPLSADDLEALARSEEDVRAGRFATEDEIREVFNRHRG